jgi:gliding motility-associated-like protein
MINVKKQSVNLLKKHLFLVDLQKLLSKSMGTVRFVKLLLICFLTAFVGFSQPLNDGCGNAITLCPNVSTAGTNYLATATVCPDCDDDFNFCFAGTNSVWYKFTTNANGGTAVLSFSSLLFNTQVNRGNQLQAAIFEALAPCDASTFTLVSNCIDNATTNFQLTATNLLPNTTYYIVVNGAKNNNAPLSAEATFNLILSGNAVDRLPVSLTIAGPTSNICPSTPTTYVTYISNCQDTSLFSWSINNTVVATTLSPFWTSSTLQNGDILSVSCSCFEVCTENYTFTLDTLQVDSLWVDAGPDQTVEAGTTVQLNGQSNGTSYQWQPSFLVSNPTTLVPFVVPNTTTTYFLTVSQNSCTLVDEVTVFITDNITIPGSFSPNNDGANDTWIIEGIADFPNTQVLIYNRWGQVVADITGYNDFKAWNGTNQGKQVSDGVYFYVIDFNDPSKKEKLKGNVTLIR